jgi:hypothetical protein
LLRGGKKFNRKNVNDFTLLGKLLAKPSCEHPPTMTSANYHSGTPLLPTMPFPDRNDKQMVLADCCMPRRWVGGTKVAVGGWRPPWMKRVSGANFVSVLCAV